ncbi:transposase [Rodentibacter rarus]|uniref:Transposase n=1 Tax=Rodentibacter rarus TaxID=1908260 RepID=A0A1V3IL65_9PAST|nr:transposase [Rodentibacter rarus]OOF42583.1 transposase [Rodentibacter rarus]
MTRYNPLFKQQVLEFYLQHNKNRSLARKQFHLKERTLRFWITRFNHCGINGLTILNHKQIYSPEFELTVIQAVKNGHYL